MPDESAIELPAGSCDCHIHVFGPHETYPIAATADYHPDPASSPEYQKLAAGLGLERVVVVQPSVYGFDNRRTLDAVTEFGVERARAVVHIETGATAEDIGRLHAAGARGVRFITQSTGGPQLDDLETIAELVAPFGWHVQLYVFPEQVIELANRLLALPVPVVLDHHAGLTTDKDQLEAALPTVERLLASDNCWVKIGSARASTSGSSFEDLVELNRRLVDLAPDRSVFGTDWPHPNMSAIPDDTQLVARLVDALGDGAALRTVLVDNPAKLYGFDQDQQSFGGTQSA